MMRALIPVIQLCLCLQWKLTTVIGQSCDTTLTATLGNTNQTAIGGSGTCTWTINTQNATNDKLREVFGDATFTVQVYFKTTEFSNPNTCDETNGILVYDGDTTGTILGLVCKDSHPTFQSSRSTLTIRYPASLATDTSSFLIVYKQILPSMCGSPTMYTVSSNEYSIVSPMYPDGIQTIPLSCSWFVRPPDNTERGLVTIETTSTICAQVNITVRHGYERDTVDWCPGQENHFISWQKPLSLKLQIASGQGVQVKYRALEASPCNITLNVTTQEQFLTTPGYPSPYPSFTECHWKLRNYYHEEPEYSTIRLEIVEMDMEETEGCRTDSLSVKNGWYTGDEVIGTTCGGDPTTFYVYEWMSLVTFRSVRPSNTRKGIKIKYYAGKPEPCGGNLTASSTTMSIQSPGFPIAYPNSARCVWTITAESPDGYISFDFVVAEIFSAFTRCGDAVSVYDGSSESGYLLAEVCKTTGAYQSSERTITVVFHSDRSFNGKGFKMNYEETKGTVTMNRQLKTRRAEAILISPRYPDGQVKDLDITWTFNPHFSYNQMRLMFTEVDLGDPADCSDNYIQVFYGNTSSPQSSKLCGTQTGVYMSKLLTVVMKTGNNPAKRGFKAKYYMLYNHELGGCSGETEVLDVYSGTDALETPFYPSAYPNLANCVYIIKAFSDNYYIHVKVEDVDLTNQNNCSSDYFEIYDGNSTDSTSFGRICQNTTKTFNSTGSQILVRFVSDANLAGRGAKITYQSIWIKHDSGGTSYVWVIILVCVIGGLVIVGVVVYYYLTHRRKRGSAAI